MSEFHKELSRRVDLLCENARVLNATAMAFSTTGNDSMSARLTSMAQDIREDALAILEAWNQLLRSDFDAQTQHWAKTLEACLERTK